MDTARGAIDTGPVVGPGCPDTEELAALLSPALDAGRRAAIIDHTAGCGACHGLVAELAGGDDVAELAGGDDVAALDATFGTSADAAGAHGELAASALDRRTKIGRYHLLEIVGAGGMGVVWGAWDPELARRVALKLVHPRLGVSPDRMVAEGQALARLSHPNVVPVYDVGVVDDHVYLVMEWVQGTTLRAYAASPCSRRALVAAYRQAGEGLAAAHRAGLVHRDFKPDNAIRGDDDRVRVLDFGLARSDAEQPEQVRRLAGTPRYMPPEQAAGEVVTAAADQFAFARSLHEGLTHGVAGRAGELPGWLAAVIARATAAAPGDRFASMGELLRALDRDPLRIWRRRGIAAAAVAAAVVAFAVGRAHGGVATCAGSAAEVARAWNPAVRAIAVAHLRGLGAFGAAEADRLGEQLDRYSGEWVDAHRGACVAHDGGELPTTLYERRISCLARGRAALTAAVELIGQVPSDGLAAALIAARTLPSAAGCAAADASQVAPPPAAVAARVAAVELAIARARVLAVGARADAVTVAHAAVTAAEATGYAPVIARAVLVKGLAEVELHVGEEVPRATLDRAVDLALRAGDDVLAVEAYARLVFAVARFRGDVVDNWSAMRALASRTGALGRFGRALLYNNKAVARNAAGDRAGARALLQHALAESPGSQVAEGGLELIAVLANLALFADEPLERAARARQVVSYFEAVLGPNHPRSLTARAVLATLTRNPAAAEAEYRVVCDGLRRWHPQRTRALADCEFRRGWLADERGDLAVARAAMQLVADEPGTPLGRAAIARSYLAVTGGGDARAAIGTMLDFAAARAADAEWWNRGEAAAAYVVAGLGGDRLGEAAAAERSWSAALALLEAIDQPDFDRLLARVRATLARRWIDARPDAARRLAAEAAAWYISAGGYERAVAELTALAAPR
jgi:eukaryotic-like serine/threonine-protein kinase